MYQEQQALVLKLEKKYLENNRLDTKCISVQKTDQLSQAGLP